MDAANTNNEEVISNASEFYKPEILTSYYLLRRWINLISGINAPQYHIMKCTGSFKSPGTR